MSDIKKVLEGFLAELADRLEPHDLEEVLKGEKGDLSGRTLGVRPESFTENNLIWKLLDAVGLEKQPRPYEEQGGRVKWPDFKITNLDLEMIGENKPLNNIKNGEKDIKDYLDRISVDASFGIATDGFNWRIYTIEKGGDFTSFPLVAKVDLLPVLWQLAVDNKYIAEDGLPMEIQGIESTIEEFNATFSPDALNQLLTTEPKNIREERNQDIQDFYDLYIELLFGEGEKGYEYNTTLLNDIIAPASAEESDKRIFAITLVNRLFFVKFLEDLEVLPEGLLGSRVEEYREHEDGFVGTLYDTQIKPLFYQLLNTPVDQRSPKHRDSWFENVPYLNGGLFRQNVDKEKEYRVEDRILPKLITDLIERQELEKETGHLDPSILGSVFEKTINYIGGELGSQKEIGGYYTPNDVTELVNEGVVRSKIRDLLVEVYSSNYSEEVRQRMSDYSLRELLRYIENGQGKWFQDPKTTEEAYNKLGELKILDPAVGSGHFLTAVMDEIHRARMSLLRGLNGGREPEPIERFKSKKELALNALYGVDVHRIGVEIAKLRIWLKIIEGGWKPEFGKLPNIDINILAGNSLVGFPEIKKDPSSSTIPMSFTEEEDLNELIEMREDYKQRDIGGKREILDLASSLETELNDMYLQRLQDMNYKVETSIDSPDEFEDFADCLNATNLLSVIFTIKVSKPDNTPLTGEEIDRLDNLGFNTYTNSARLSDLKDGVDKLIEASNNTIDRSEAKESLVDELEELLRSGFVFEELTRKPVRSDLDNILGQPFHWPVEFPEVIEGSEEEKVPEFDIVVGNPPYGDILDQPEEVILHHYVTGSYTEISANFVERELQLLADGGWFGNVTTTGLLNKNSMCKLHDMLEQKFENLRIASFARRPHKVFKNAEINVAISQGKKQAGNHSGNICTSDFIRFEKGNRDERFRDIEYSPIDGLVMRDRMGSKEREQGKEALPCVGGEMKKNILLKLADWDRSIDDITGEEKDYQLYSRRSGDYWTNVTIDYVEGLKNMYKFSFSKSLNRDFVYLALNSSLFYMYWFTYGNMHDITKYQVKRFPIPTSNILSQNSKEISSLTEELRGVIQKNLTPKKSHQFHLKPAKPLIDEIEGFLGDMYDITDREVEYLRNYHSEYGRSAVE